MRIRSFTHAMTLIADTMLPWELYVNGRVRVDTANPEASQPLHYCPLCAVAQTARPGQTCPSGIFPDEALQWAGFVISTKLLWRIMDAADNTMRTPRQRADRALLLAACGLP